MSCFPTRFKTSKPLVITPMLGEKSEKADGQAIKLKTINVLLENEIQVE